MWLIEHFTVEHSVLGVAELFISSQFENINSYNLKAFLKSNFPGVKLGETHQTSVMRWSEFLPNVLTGQIVKKFDW